MTSLLMWIIRCRREQLSILLCTRSNHHAPSHKCVLFVAMGDDSPYGPLCGQLQTLSGLGLIDLREPYVCKKILMITLKTYIAVINAFRLEKIQRKAAPRPLPRASDS